MASSIMSLTPVTDTYADAEAEVEVGSGSSDLEPCKIFGPSCDSIDLVCPRTYLPVSKLDVGDWLRWKNMGAYTICSASQFNGFRFSEVRYTVDCRGEQGVEEEVRRLLASSGV